MCIRDRVALPTDRVRTSRQSARLPGSSAAVVPPRSAAEAPPAPRWPRAGANLAASARPPSAAGPRWSARPAP
eukprot:14973321-Alexandrium_andersonii.AAC.1